MNSEDKERMAIDAIRQMAYTLPTGYKSGLVAYNTEIQAVLKPEKEPERMEETLEALQYTGYTNAGAGLEQAVSLFSEEEGTQKYIVMISDGEIDMPKEQEKELSRLMYSEAAAKAKEQGIKILIIAIGTQIKNPQMHIFDGAQITDGAIYWEGQAGNLTQIMHQIMTGRMKMPLQSIGVTDSGGGSAHVKLPSGASRTKLLLMGEDRLDQVSAEYSAENGRTVSGQRFAVVDIYRPYEESAEVYFQTENIEGVKAYLLTEYEVEPKVNVAYRMEEIPRTEEEIKKKIPAQYEHYADVTIQLISQADTTVNLWQTEGLENTEITYMLNGVTYTGAIMQGQVCNTLDADGIENVTVTVDIKEQDALYYSSQPVTVDIEKKPDPVPEPEPDYRPLYVVLVLLMVALSAVFIFWLKRSRTTVIYMASSKAPEKKMETKNCTYSGRLNMYVVQTQDGRDISPQTYRLFGKGNGRMSLDRILTSCGIRFGRIGADDIVIYPGPDKSIIVMDQSEQCTVMRGMEILKKGMGYPVFYNEKITVTFEDGVTEMEIHYKNLKPGERENKEW